MRACLLENIPKINKRIATLIKNSRVPSGLAKFGLTPRKWNFERQISSLCPPCSPVTQPLILIYTFIKLVVIWLILAIKHKIYTKY